MRCYRSVSGVFFATKAQAASIAGPDDFEQVEVPDDKRGLLDFLNDLMADSIVVGFNNAASAPPPIQPPPTPAPIEPSLTDVESFIQSADHRQLCSITENAILRMRELCQEAGR
jgi:hypothetical protein